MKEKFITIPLPFLNVNIRGQVWERNRVEIPSGEEHGYYNDSSSSTSIRILALHGWLDNSSTFARIAPYICERFPNMMSVHITAVDFLGHGLSDHLAKETIDPYNFPSRIIEVSLILKELEWESCYILGHSLGGAVAASVAASLGKEKILGVISIDALGPFIRSGKPSHPIDLMKTSLQTFERFATRKPRIYSSLKDGVEKYKLANEKLSLEAIQFIISRGMKKTQNGDGYYFGHDPRLLSPSLRRYSHEEALLILKEIKQPFLYVYPRKDLMGEAKERHEDKMKCIPHIDSYEIEKANHHLHLDQTYKKVGDIIIKWFSNNIGN